jgi:hypothetical protein
VVEVVAAVVLEKKAAVGVAPVTKVVGVVELATTVWRMTALVMMRLARTGTYLC